MVVIRWFALITAFLASATNAAWHEAHESHMGTAINLSFWHDDPAIADVIITDVMAEMRRIDEVYSPYKASSDLSVLNREAPKGQVEVSKEMAFLLDKSLYFGRVSDGAFDITFGSVGRFYDYREGVKPESSQRDALLEAIDYRHVLLDKKTHSVAYAHPQVYVDLGGIAKGFAVDQAAEILTWYGVKHASISAGGDSRVIGDRRGRPWLVGIKNPRQSESGPEWLIRLPLENVAVSTSGDYERFFIDENGERVHHILNPKTGASAQEVVSVTILGDKGVDTDPLSTTVFVLGVDKGLTLINRLKGFDCVIIDAKGKAHYSNGLIDPAVN